MEKRSDYQRFLDIFIGDLAKNIVKTELINLYPNIENHIKEYDRLRTDGFRNNDRYDLKILDKYTLEVKSSFEKYTTNSKTIKEKRNIIVNKENCHESETDYVFQVFYVSNNLNWFRDISDGKTSFNNLSELKENVIENFKNTNIYIAGFINKNDIINKVKVFGVEKKSENDKERKYLSFKIDDTKDLGSFREDLSNYHRKMKLENKEVNTTQKKVQKGVD